MSKLTYLLQTAGLAFVLAALMAPVIIKKLRELKFGQKILEDGGIPATVRRTLGGDIDASCGQLRRKYNREAL